jgi:hypothetical protein
MTQARRGQTDSTAAPLTSSLSECRRAAQELLYPVDLALMAQRSH